MRAWTWSAGIALALAALAGAAGAQDRDYQVRSYLEHGFAVHSQAGYSTERAIPDLVQPLQLDRPYLWSVYLEAGVNYRIYGACDDGCSDLDMEVYGFDGNLIDRDAGADDVPFVQVTPVQSGRHYVRLWLYECSAQPCHVAARVVSGGTPVERMPLLAGGPQLGQPPFADEAAYVSVVAAELDDAERRHLEAGYERFGEQAVAAIMNDGAGRDFAFALEPGWTYLFQGACDQDCSDVNLELLGPDRARMAIDDAPHDRPAVAASPAAPGAYVVTVRLAACRVEPCYVGVRAYRQRRH